MNMAESATWQRCCFCSPEQSPPEHEQHKTRLTTGSGELRAPAWALGGCAGAVGRAALQHGAGCPAGQARWGAGLQPPLECGMAAGLWSVFQGGAYICFSKGPVKLWFCVVGGGSGE